MNAVASPSLPLAPSNHQSKATSADYTWKTIAIPISVGAAAFHIAFAYPFLAPLILVYLAALVELTRARTGRLAFYSGLVFGLLIFAPKLGFFYTLFNLAAVPLWLILALWHALFAFAGRWTRSKFNPRAAALLIPIIWTGLEYFRSELYPLKFSWLSAGYAFSQNPNILLSGFGVYGTAFFLLLIVSAISFTNSKTCRATFLAAGVALFVIAQIPPDAGDDFIAALLLIGLTLSIGFTQWNRLRLAIAAVVLVLYATVLIEPAISRKQRSPVKIAGVQLEFPVPLEVPGKLDLLLKEHPDADLFVLSEYTFDGPVPARVLKWCKQNRKHLAVGGKDPAGTNFYNTAFVIDPAGEIIFKQVKAVPIQFFNDGLPAPEQKIWNSPWGKIGIGVCYDLSYTRVVDNLITQGARVLIFPTMDVIEWGKTQHELHALIAPTRAAEHGIPIFRLASSGISQATTARGDVTATAPFPGEGETLYAKVLPSSNARLPLDRYFAPVCSAAAIVLLSASFFGRWRRQR